MVGGGTAPLPSVCASPSALRPSRRPSWVPCDRSLGTVTTMRHRAGAAHPEDCPIAGGAGNGDQSVLTGRSRCGGQASPWRTAKAAAAVRDSRSSLASRWVTWPWTVWGLMKSASPISRSLRALREQAQDLRLARGQAGRHRRVGRGRRRVATPAGSAACSASVMASSRGRAVPPPRPPRTPPARGRPAPPPRRARARAVPTPAARRAARAGPRPRREAGGPLRLPPRHDDAGDPGEGLGQEAAAPRGPGRPPGFRGRRPAPPPGRRGRARGPPGTGRGSFATSRGRAPGAAAAPRPGSAPPPRVVPGQGNLDEVGAEGRRLGGQAGRPQLPAARAGRRLELQVQRQRRLHPAGGPLVVALFQVDEAQVGQRHRLDHPVSRRRATARPSVSSGAAASRSPWRRASQPAPVSAMARAVVGARSARARARSRWRRPSR